MRRWNLPDGWVISKHPAHAALVSEAEFSGTFVSDDNQALPAGSYAASGDIALAFAMSHAR